MKNMIAVILAAGRGTRMKSDIPKVLHEILGKPILGHILDTLDKAGIKDVVTVAGHGSELLKKVAGNTRIAIQKKLLGSGDALSSAKRIIGKYSGDILIVCGDTPLIRPGTIKRLVDTHKNSGAGVTILTARVKNPASYGRIIRGPDDGIVKIAEEEEAQRDLYKEVINEINVGTYCFKADCLFEALSEIRPDNDKKEFYLTDTIGILHKKGIMIDSVFTEDEAEATGVNTRADLARASKILKNRILEEIMSDGVTVEDADSTIIYTGVKIGRDTVIKPNTLIESQVKIGQRCRIGPFARIRRGVCLDDDVEVGNFVELVRTTVKSSSRIKHHTYLGDAAVGKNVNIGAGTITANFDGKNKNKTVIGDGAFIGVGARLIAPVKIGSRALVGAGSVVPKNRNVPSGATVVGVPARILKRGDRK